MVKEKKTSNQVEQFPIKYIYITNKFSSFLHVPIKEDDIDARIALVAAEAEAAAAKARAAELDARIALTEEAGVDFAALVAAAEATAAAAEAVEAVAKVRVAELDARIAPAGVDFAALVATAVEAAEAATAAKWWYLWKSSSLSY